MPRPKPFAVLGLLGLLGVACSTASGVEGKYYNSGTGEYAMELKGGRVTWMQGQEGRAMTYAIRGDSLVINDPQGGFAAGMTFGIEKDGTLSLGVLGSLTKQRP